MQTCKKCYVVPQQHTVCVPFTYTKWVPEYRTVVDKVRTCRYVPEVRTCQVPCVRCRMVPEECVAMVPTTVCTHEPYCTMVRRCRVVPVPVPEAPCCGPVASMSHAEWFARTVNSAQTEVVQAK